METSSVKSPRRSPPSKARQFVEVAVGVLAAGFLFLTAATLATAYNDYDNSACKWPYAGGSSTLAISYSNAASPNAPTGDYATALSAARVSWLNTSTPAFFFLTTSTSTHGVYALGSGSLLGTSITNCSGSTRTQTVVKLNSDTLGSGAYSAIFWKQFASAHEQGHHIGLGHSNVFPTIMQSPAPNASSFPTASFPTGGYNGPIADDECGVNHLYISTIWPATCGY